MCACSGLLCDSKETFGHPIYFILFSWEGKNETNRDPIWSRKHRNLNINRAKKLVILVIFLEINKNKNKNG